MKRFLFLSALASVALAGCVNDEAMEVTSKASDQKITFNAPVVSGLTRAQAGEQPGTGKYKTSENFKVYACWSKDAYSAWDNQNLYMNNVEVQYNNTDSWNSESVNGGTTYYWPKTGYLTFAAYSPATAKGTISYDGTGLKIDDFTVENETSTQYDLMFSERSYNRTASTGGTSYSGVDINFKHALSSIKFKVAQKDEYLGTTLKLTKIEILKAFSSGDFAQGLTDGANAVTTDAKWSDYKTEYDYTAWSKPSSGANENGQALTTTATTPENISDIILLPQAFKHESNVVSIKVDYTIQNGDGPVLGQTKTLPLVTTEGDADRYYTDKNGNGISEWEMGKRYIYTITIGLEKIYFSPEVVEWVDVEVPGLTI